MHRKASTRRNPLAPTHSSERVRNTLSGRVRGPAERAWLARGGRCSLITRVTNALPQHARGACCSEITVLYPPRAHGSVFPISPRLFQTARWRGANLSTGEETVPRTMHAEVQAPLGAHDAVSQDAVPEARPSGLDPRAAHAKQSGGFLVPQFTRLFGGTERPRSPRSRECSQTNTLKFLESARLSTKGFLCGRVKRTPLCIIRQTQIETMSVSTTHLPEWPQSKS